MRIRDVVLPLICLLLVSCANNNSSSSSSGTDTSIITSGESSSSSESSTSITTSTSGERKKEYTDFPSPIQSEVDPSSFDETAIPVNLTAINDFHGQLFPDASDYRVGLSKMAGYLAERKRQGDILISSGDNFQGSYLCSYDQGEFVTSAFKYLNFDAYTIGNHEFDWGLSALLDGENSLGQKYLGANVYNYPKVDGDWVKSTLGRNYKIVTLYEDTAYEVKVGIIGVIGKSQISSIVSTYVEDYIFLDPTPIVKELSYELRDEQGCDIVIASYHDAGIDTSVTEDDPLTGKPYVDACFTAHTHKYEYDLVNGVPIIQASAYSRGVSTVNFTYNKTTSETSLVDSKYEYLSTMSLTNEPEVESRLTQIRLCHQTELTITIGNNTLDHALSDQEMSRYYAKLAYDKGRIERSDLKIVGTMFNQSRRDLKQGDFTFAELYETHPFINEVYVFSVRGDNIHNRMSSQYGYFNPEVEIINDNSHWYDIIVYSYNGFHIGINAEYEKYYNLFSTAFSSYAEHPPILLSFNVVQIALDQLSKTHYIYENEVSGEGFF